MATIADRATYIRAQQTLGRFCRPKFAEVENLVQDIRLLARQIEKARSFTLKDAQQMLAPLHLDKDGHMLAEIVDEPLDVMTALNLNERGNPIVTTGDIDNVLGQLSHLFPLDEMTMLEMGTAFESEEYIELWPENVGPWCWDDEIFEEYLDDPVQFEDGIRLEVFVWAIFQAWPETWARLDKRFHWNIEQPSWDHNLYIDWDLFELRMRQAGLGPLLVVCKFVDYATGCVFFDFNPNYYGQGIGMDDLLPRLSAKTVVKLVGQWRDGLRLLLVRRQAYRLVRRNPGALQQWIDILLSCLGAKPSEKEEGEIS